MTENRKHPRRQVHPNATWGKPGGPNVEANCRDVSLGGCFLEADAPPAFGTSVVVYLELPGLLGDDGTPTVATITSTVRWTTAAGMGVQFGPMGVRETHALVQLLSGQPLREEG